MRAFCRGEPGYSAIVRDFGRRPIQDWTLIDLVKRFRVPSPQHDPLLSAEPS